MAGKKIVLFTSQNCGPCQEVKALAQQGKLEDEVEIVDIETDEGFERFQREVLGQGDGAVPSAYHEGAKCRITIEDEKLKFHCPADEKAEEPVAT